MLWNTLSAVTLCFSATFVDVIQIKWHVGSKCRCKYSEDGLTYDATVISLDDDGETCTVRYAYYDNEECQRLCDLIPLSGGGDAHQLNSSIASDVSD